jgi:hypothetical protein
MIMKQFHKELVTKVGLKILIHSTKGKKFIIEGSFVQELDQKVNHAQLLKETEVTRSYSRINTIL